MKHFYNLKVFKHSQKRNLKTAALCSLFLIGSYASIDAQAKAYSFAQSTGTFTAVTGGTVLGTATASTGAASLYNVFYPVTMPFSFNYNGKVYSSLKVASNGYISFGGTADPTDNTPISGTEDWDGAVSAWGRSNQAVYNVSNTTGDIRWETVGTAPNREMVIQWTNFKPIYSTVTTYIYAFSFQIRLKETSNQIVTTYNSGSYLSGSTTITGTAQIGLRGATNSDYNNRLNTSTLAFTSATSGTSNTSTQYFNTSSTAASGMPPAGLTYTWTPPTCFAPTLTTGSATTNSITVNWTAPTPTPGSYDVYYNTTGAVPTSTTTPTQTNVTGTTATIPSLAGATTHYVWVRSGCGTGNTSSWTLMPIKLTTQCQPAALQSTNGATVCPGNTATLTASTTAGANIKWYDSATGGTQLATGNSYTTPVLTSTTNYWVSTAQSQNMTGGKSAPVSVTGNTGVSSLGLIIDANKDMVVNTVDIYPYTTTAANAGTGAGTVTINLVNSGGTILQTNTYTVNVAYTAATAAASPPTTISLNYNVPAGTGYKLVVTAKSSTISGFIRENDESNFSFPYIIGDICSLNTTTSGYYYYLYNLNVTSACESSRTQVTATVDSAGCLGTSETEAKETVKVHPNPFTEIININKAELVKTAKIMDVSGKLIRTINNPQSSINLQDISEGLYVLALEMKDGTQQSIKIIKK
ncbi:T9SS type A sorting domain-containing protein [Chryseobacterium camelliae]|uniref:T9SS type A sorting domain-containing protein n=1 Tax=Chryseobacterium camelliae TaxID=1265445 RepID=A0ABY7QHL2_9FLAO|nr:T9SS type A sorting domain-containing protein [Chryseobacterium camelliae]WBV59077.1 T9SS type A sorting domain-containing protein [Chryseobacterium camelliae]